MILLPWRQSVLNFAALLTSVICLPADGFSQQIFWRVIVAKAQQSLQCDSMHNTSTLKVKQIDTNVDPSFYYSQLCFSYCDMFKMSCVKKVICSASHHPLTSTPTFAPALSSSSIFITCWVYYTLLLIRDAYIKPELWYLLYLNQVLLVSKSNHGNVT